MPLFSPTMLLSPQELMITRSGFLAWKNRSAPLLSNASMTSKPWWNKRPFRSWGKIWSPSAINIAGFFMGHLPGESHVSINPGKVMFDSPLCFFVNWRCCWANIVPGWRKPRSYCGGIIITNWFTYIMLFELGSPHTPHGELIIMWPGKFIYI